MGIKFDKNQKKLDILALNRLKIFDAYENYIQISTLWKEKSVVLVFMRHFRCIACRAHVDMVMKRKREFDKQNMQVVFIGNGHPQFINKFKKEMNLPDAPIYTDPSLEAFDAFDMVRGAISLTDPRGIIKMFEFGKKGYKQGGWDYRSGSHLQMGGIVVVAPPGKVIYHHISRFIGDLEDVEDWKYIVEA